ncbi:MAG: alpha/beta fold hydrolase [Catenulispora sp.]|nr:alpha/beta fold hydrolase [Catenulispora sp.]
MTSSTIADILPLAPAQRGLLFHALQDPETDPYITQTTMELHGDLDAERLRHVVHALVRRHPNLGAAFRHRGLKHPVQLIPAAVEIPWHDLDLSAFGEAEQEARFRRFLADDRARRFDIGKPPLLRCALIRYTARKHVLILTCHHMVLDGWSVPVLVSELLADYGADPDAGPRPAARYRDYLAWVAEQDREAALARWHATITGLARPTIVGGADRGTEPGPPESVESALSAEHTRSLSGWARASRLTLSSVLQGVWGLMLTRMTGDDDVVFGATVSGRPAGLAGVDAMVGCFINTLPVRIAPAVTAGTADLLQTLQRQQVELTGAHHVSLAEIQRALGLGRLFDTAVVYHNYPSVEHGAATADGDLELAALHLYSNSHYPLTLVVHPGERLHLRLNYRTESFSKDDAETILQALIRVLEAVPDTEDISSLLPLLDGVAERGADGDRRPDPVTGADPDRATARRRAAAQRILRTLFAEALGVPTVAAGDDFFDRGGDSLVAIQVADRARELGWPLTTRQLIEHPTPSALAAVLARDPGPGTDRPAADARGAGDAAGVGEIPLTPVMRSFTQRGDDISGFYQATVLRTPAALTGPDLAGIIGELARRHPALRMRIVRTAGGQWQPTVADPGSFDATVGVRHVDFAGRTGSDLRTAVSETLAGAFRARDGVIDPVLRAVFFDAGPEEPGRLLIAVHHFAVDGVSWRILVSEIQAVWRGVRLGVTARARETGTTFRGWARTLTSQAERGARRAELDVWRAVAGTSDRPWTQERLDPARDTVAGSATVVVEMSPQRCAALLAGVPAEIGGTAGEALVGAVGVAVADWRRRRGRGGDDRVLIDLETHGREEFAEGLDLAGTVGWFTSVHPVVLDLGPGGESAPLSDRAAVARILTSVREQMKALPDNGLGYGVLRWLDPVAGPELARLGRPQIRVNFLGRFPAGGTADWARAPEFPVLLAGIDGATPIEYLVQLDSYIEDSPHGPRLVAHFTWPERLLSAAEVEDLAQTWFAVLDRVAEPAGTGELMDGSPGAPVLDLTPDRWNNSTNVFCVHPIEGDAWCYEHFAKALDQDIRVYGLQARGLDGSGPGASTLGEMVADYANRIRAIQPHGPYRLVGWSFGGIVAHALAAHFQRSGERVDLLAILDVAPAADLGLSEPPTDVGSDVIARNLRLSGSFTSGVFDGDVLYVVAADEPGATKNPEKWRPHVTGAFTEYSVPAGHAGLLDPGPADEVARIIGGRLRTGASPSVSTTSVGGTP